MPKFSITWFWLANSVCICRCRSCNKSWLFISTLILNYGNGQKNKQNHHTLWKSQVRTHYKMWFCISNFRYRALHSRFVQYMPLIQRYVPQYYLPMRLYRLAKSIRLLDTHQSDYQDTPAYWPAPSTSITRATLDHKDVLESDGAEPGKWFHQRYTD